MTWLQTGVIQWVNIFSKELLVEFCHTGHMEFTSVFSVI